MNSLQQQLDDFVKQGQSALATLESMSREIQVQADGLKVAATRLRKLRQEIDHSMREATGPTKSRTAVMQERRLKKDLCADCGDEPLEFKLTKDGSGSHRYGPKCLAKRAKWKRSRDSKQ